MPTTAGTKRRLSDLVRVTPVVLITPTAPPKSVPGPAIQVISKKEALVSWRIPVRHIINVTARISIVPERPVRRILQNAAFIVLTTCIRTAALITVFVTVNIIETDIVRNLARHVRGLWIIPLRRNLTGAANIKRTVTVIFSFLTAVKYIIIRESGGRREVLTETFGTNATGSAMNISNFANGRLWELVVICF